MIKRRASGSEEGQAVLNDRLHRYTMFEETVVAIEAERRRLAERLEDSILGPLNLLLAQANAYEQTMVAYPPAHTALAVLNSLIRQAIQQARDLQTDLHPTILEALGLGAALETLAGQMIRAHGLRVSLSLQRISEQAPFPIELALFRAAQDALDRAARSARAAQVWIRLDCREARLRLSIADDGIAASGAGERDAVRRRVEQLGGVFVESVGADGRFELVVEFVLHAPVPLTAREMDVLQLLSEGLSNKEIAAALHLSPRTVNFHLDNIYSKLGVGSRTEAVIYALRQGWVRHGPGTPVK